MHARDMAVNVTTRHTKRGDFIQIPPELADRIHTLEDDLNQIVKTVGLPEYSLCQLSAEQKIFENEWRKQNTTRTSDKMTYAIWKFQVYQSVLISTIVFLKKEKKAQNKYSVPSPTTCNNPKCKVTHHCGKKTAW